jgi:hypothetical protein
MEVNQLDGDYEGMLATYDWSGKIVVKETPLSLSLTTNGRSVVAEWREQGADTVTVSAEWRDSSLVFVDASQGRRGHYDADRKQRWSFTNARLQLLQDDTASYLAGNLQLYSLESYKKRLPFRVAFFSGACRWLTTLAHAYGLLA